MDDNKTVLYMTVGIPGSGKSTYARLLSQKGLKVHSADALRGQLYGDVNCKDDPNKVYAILHENIRSDLEKGISCLYDASNTSRRKRRKFLLSIPENCHKICLLFLVPPDVCRQRLSGRMEQGRKRDIDQYLRNMDLPYWYEGWDEIIPVICEENFSLPMEMMMDFSQDNPHHKLSLGQHMDMAYRLSLGYTDDGRIQTAARFHDCGKYYTKDFRNYRGHMTDRAHFYGHANYGAYLFILDAYEGEGQWKYGNFETSFYIAQLINWHMHPLDVWSYSGQARSRDEKLLGHDMMKDIMTLHRADIDAH